MLALFPSRCFPGPYGGESLVSSPPRHFPLVEVFAFLFSMGSSLSRDRSVTHLLSVFCYSPVGLHPTRSPLLDRTHVSHTVTDPVLALPFTPGLLFLPSLIPLLDPSGVFASFFPKIVPPVPVFFLDQREKRVEISRREGSLPSSRVC